MVTRRYAHATTVAIPGSPGGAERALASGAPSLTTVSGINSFGMLFEGRTIKAGTVSGSVRWNPQSTESRTLTVTVKRWDGTLLTTIATASKQVFGGGTQTYGWSSEVANDVVFGAGEWLVYTLSPGGSLGTLVISTTYLDTDDILTPTTPEITTSLPVAIDLGGVLDVPALVIPELATSLPLAVDLGGVLDAPVIPVPEITTALPLEIDLGGELYDPSFIPEITTSLPLVIDLGGELGKVAGLLPQVDIDTTTRRRRVWDKMAPFPKTGTHLEEVEIEDG